MDQKNPTVFISYSHDSKEHQDKVLELSNRLRSQGIDCSLDQYEDSPPEGWPKWMDRKVIDSDFILIVCTEMYYNRSLGKEERGMGIKWESTLVYQHLYNAGSKNTKFIPIIFNDGKFEHIPIPLQGATFYNIDNPKDYDSLYFRLLGIKKDKPPLGEIRKLPARERKTVFVSDLMDQAKWDKATWQNGVAYLFANGIDLPPMVTVLFDDIELGKQIFKGLIDKIGDEDKNERLRLAFIEGIVPNQGAGYFVVIGEYIDATYSLLEDKGNSKEINYIVIGQRINRVKVEKTPRSLQDFKKEYEKYGCYFIVPAKHFVDPKRGNAFIVERDFKIFKKKVEFREYKDIPNENDPDSILKSDEVIKHKF